MAIGFQYALNFAGSTRRVCKLLLQLASYVNGIVGHEVGHWMQTEWTPRLEVIPGIKKLSQRNACESKKRSIATASH